LSGAFIGALLVEEKGAPQSLGGLGAVTEGR
jgi:hypothetical protein